jgi:basic amino acid/polyamine antiporter, APA family
MTKPRKLGAWMCVALVMGNMIGSGVFLLPASLAPFGWNAVAGWCLTIIGALLLTYVFSQLTVHHPHAGGPIGFVDQAFGRTTSFMIGWSYWVSIWTTAVTISAAAISYLGLLLPGVGTHSTIATIGLMWIITLLNLAGARTAGQFQLITWLLKLAPLVAVMLITAWVVIARRPMQIIAFPAEGLSFTAVNGAALLTLWALLGFESASMATDKVEDPRRTIPRATMIGTLATGLLYLCVCSAIALMLPVDALTKSPAPFALFVETYWSHGAAQWIAAFAAVSAIGALGGWTLLQGELPAAMARRDLLPSALARENSSGAPSAALLLSCAISTLFVLANTSKSAADLFTFMAKLSTSAALWLYLACALAAVRLRIARLMATLGALYALWTLWGAGLDISALSLLLMLAGLPFYYARRSNRPMKERSAKIS